MGPDESANTEFDSSTLSRSPAMQDVYTMRIEIGLLHCILEA